MRHSPPSIVWRATHWPSSRQTESDTERSCRVDFQLLITSFSSNTQRKPTCASRRRRRARAVCRRRASEILDPDADANTTPHRADDWGFGANAVSNPIARMAGGPPPGQFGAPPPMRGPTPGMAPMRAPGPAQAAPPPFDPYACASLRTHSLALAHIEDYARCVALAMHNCPTVLAANRDPTLPPSSARRAQRRKRPSTCPLHRAVALPLARLAPHPLARRRRLRRAVRRKPHRRRR